MNTRLKMAASQRWKTLIMVVVLLSGGLLPIRGAGADINEQVARLDLEKATLDDAIRVFGEPRAYAWNGKTFTKDRLPSVYVLEYTNSFGVLINGGRVEELRFEGPEAGYVYRGKLAKLSEQPAGPVTFPKIDRRPAPWDLHRGFLELVPKYDPASNSPSQVDLRGYNLSRLDLREAGASLPHAIFDDKTIWPAPDRLPKDFDRARIVELGKDPGLGIRSLHAKGITGRGVGIAIVDTPLVTEHQEYAAHLRLYEEINVYPNTEAHMHGPAVASIAVGGTVGVAPEADLYFIAAWPMDLGTRAHEEGPLNFAHYARAVRRILQINDQLPAERKIRVISISMGWEPGQKGYAEVTAAVEEAKAEGVFVICSSLTRISGFRFFGLGRDMMSDPDEFASYRLARWGPMIAGRRDHLLVPMEARTTASPSGKEDYTFSLEGGLSWCIPYIAGAYALAAQVDPKITPERFWALALKTGRIVQVPHEGKSLDLGPILDPAQLLEAVRRGDLSDKAAVAAELAKYSPPSPRGQSQARVSNERIPEDLAARIARLDIDNAGRKDVIEQLGKPESYMLGKDVLDANNLPSRYTMMYRASVRVFMSAGRIERIVVLAPGYLFHDKIQVGTTLEEVFTVLGPPAKTIENVKEADAFRAQEDGVFYQDMDGIKGTCLYRSRAQGVALVFEDRRVCLMMLLPKDR
jgi:hypothetical protein